ncbi:MAG TPA: hypothetical protein VN200_11370 [Rhodoglobus sp.]|nr:hypothetical protein [Rhodoglobus sp.]
MTKQTSTKLTPGQHAALDYAIGAGNLLLPSVLRARGRSRAVLGLFGAAQTVVNAFTKQPYALADIIPWKTHRTIDLGYLAGYAVVPVLAGVTSDRRARPLWLAVTVAGLAVFALTDWDAKKTATKR